MDILRTIVDVNREIVVNSFFDDNTEVPNDLTDLSSEMLASLRSRITCRIKKTKAVEKLLTESVSRFAESKESLQPTTAKKLVLSIHLFPKISPNTSFCKEPTEFRRKERCHKYLVLLTSTGIRFPQSWSVSFKKKEFVLKTYLTALAYKVAAKIASHELWALARVMQQNIEGTYQVNLL